MDRWIEVSSSEFPHEAEGLEIVRRMLPDEPGYRAWSNFEFRDSNGRWSEVDLLLLLPSGLHLVELKWYSGTIGGNDSIWLRSGGRAEDSPLKLARRKAQRLASRLKDEWRKIIVEKDIRDAPPAKDIIPWVQEAVFLHHDRVNVTLPHASRRDLYGLEGLEASTELPGIGELFRLPSDGKPRGSNAEAILTLLLERIGLKRSKRTAGQWELDGETGDDADGWQTWDATHKITNETAQIRFAVATTGASAEDVKRNERVVVHEQRTLSQLSHENILRPRDVVEGDLGIGLVLDFDPEWRRLDHWLAEHPQGTTLEEQLAIIRQVGDALNHAHNNRVVHRGIDPHAVFVVNPSGPPKVLVGEWQTVGALSDPTTSRPTETGVTRLFLEDTAALPGFSAPEGALMRQIDRVRVDVFGLGALAYYVLTGKAPAASRPALKERLRNQNGLDISVDLPQVATPIRDAILRATRPAVSERTKDVSTFISELTRREEPTFEEVDPLEAAVGDVLGGRFRVKRLLGSGSTAQGLLVDDEAAGKERVLKVALDDAARERLADEAEVLRKISSPLIAKLIEGPISLHDRHVLVLSNAGEETLAHALRNRERVQLDLLERWGGNLLDMLVHLDDAGILHRDIKPSNLGIRTNPGTRVKELNLFDFSLSRAPASSVTAGTPPYLDPFLEGKRHFDSAAERYAAAVVLFEMATGHSPIFGDGLSDPAVIDDEASIDPTEFDPAVGQRLALFFRKALARSAKKRHLTAQEMRSAWLECFVEAETDVAPDADERAASAGLSTKLTEAGLSARAISALETYKVVTVEDLLSLDGAVLSSLRGAKMHTRQEIQRRKREWRKRLGSVSPTAPTSDSTTSTYDLADLLLEAVRTKRSTLRSILVAHLLGIVGDIDAFGTQAQFADALEVTPGRISQVLPELQEIWGKDPATREALDQLLAVLDGELRSLGGVATSEELARNVAAVLVPDPRSEERDERRVEGLVRLAVERRKALATSEDVEPHALRRADDYLLIAETPELLDVAEQLGRAADALVSRTGVGELVPSLRVMDALQREVPGDLPQPTEPTRLATLAAATASDARASSAGELHHRKLPPERAIALVVGRMGSRASLSPDELRDRVAARFPSLGKLPQRPKLDELLTEVPWRFDEERRLYVSTAQDRRAGTELESRPATQHVVEVAPVSAHGVVGQRLVDSTKLRSFLALGVQAPRLGRMAEVLTEQYGATTLNLSATLIAALKEHAESRGVPWQAVLIADAAPTDSRARKGLGVLMAGSMAKVGEAIDEALERGTPVYLTDASLYVQHGGLAQLANWIDLTTSRQQALWLEVPQVHGNQGAVLELKPLPLSSLSQFFTVDNAWIDQQHRKDLAS